MLFFFLGKMQLHADNRIELTDFNSMADFILLPLQRIKLNIHLIFGIDKHEKDRCNGNGLMYGIGVLFL